MINRCKGARSTTNDTSIQIKLDKALKAASLAVVNLFENGKLQRIDDPSYYKQFSDSSETCTGKLHVLVQQQEDLIISYNDLIIDYENGVKVMKLYRQMKMYNDKNLNPVLYKKSSSN